MTSMFADRRSGARFVVEADGLVVLELTSLAVRRGRFSTGWRGQRQSTRAFGMTRWRTVFVRRGALPRSIVSRSSTYHSSMSAREYQRPPDVK